MSHPLLEIELPAADRRVRVLSTDRSDGDVHPDRVDGDVLRQRQLDVSGRPWVMLDQVHGVGVHRVADRSDAQSPIVGVGDVLVNRSPDVDIAVWAADCAPLVLIAADGRVVAAHGGWRGLAAGVIDVAVDEATAGGVEVVAAVLGPVIHRCCYAFGTDDLSAVAAGVGATEHEIAGTDAGGALALDVPAAVGLALQRRGISLDVVGPCTGCDDRWYSHRVRTDVERHGVVVSIT